MMHHLRESVRNWRTSTAGAGALIFAVADLVTQFHNSDWDANRLGADVLAIITGLGLVSARDGIVSAEEHHEDRERLTEHGREIDKVAEVAEVAAVAAGVKP